ncbi:hypothetical protein AVL62_01005 [Serinicoccus chungangensis]|uniref:HhH-GPD domain-containing protein n=1 Tax=Serinicoccus chungangensis TaxID=767452 RepID=A0A0W8I5K7_9MICO|nr:hypothetical protein [Serinicoccus chungangensis]KUG53409.1 hypothetical protein AVL62_01005 [Serinicoccus chungangensis]
MITTDDVMTLQRAIDTELPRPWTEWPGGWPDEVEAALLDAVLSIRARYGREETGVRGAVERYRQEVNGGRLDDLPRLASFDADRLAEVLRNEQRASGRPKAQAIVEAARSLVDAGLRSAVDLDLETHKRAYTRVHGLGWITWEYFTMLLGQPGAKADTWVVRWVSQQLNRDVSSKEARSLLGEVATQLSDGETNSPRALLTRLDHQIWRTARSAQPSPARESTSSR